MSGTVTMHTFSDSEALILIDIVFIRDRNNSCGPLNEDMQIASIQFNNLDVVGWYTWYFNQLYLNQSLVSHVTFALLQQIRKRLSN